MRIDIFVPFRGAAQMVSVWAFDEENIDFGEDSFQAARCTCSYAAVELKKYLTQTLENSDIRFTESKTDEIFTIELQIGDNASRSDEFLLKPQPNGLLIRGKGRTGLLYGVYELLRLQGWRWYAPGDEGEIQPEKRKDLIMPRQETEFTPSYDNGRGFDFGQWYSKDSIKFWVWMSKNRMNVAGYRVYTAPLCDKLGMQFKIGGHIFEKCLDPDKMTPSGKTLWEEHKDWFGQAADGTRKKELAQKIQFCTSNEDLTSYLADEVLRYLNTKWKHADRVDIWGFDTWGYTCNCDKCNALGNDTDKNLHFLSDIRTQIDRARADGRLDHDVKMVFCGYEGTCTITGPQNPIPQNLLDAGDLMVYYPIRRCYAHDFSDETCEINAFYKKSLKSWLDKKPAVPVVIGEYYNVSKFEDLPLIFSQRIAADIPYYHQMGVRSATYMHVPMNNQGMRTLTQLLYAQMCWDVHTDVNKLLNEYFENWYGPYAEEMREAYRLTEEAWLYCADWRAWGPRSVLSQLLEWDGTKPENPLTFDNHFQTADGALKSGRQSVRQLQKALDIVNEVRQKDLKEAALKGEIKIGAGVNPDDAKKFIAFNRYTKRIGEDRRLLIYASQTMQLMAETVAYHNALYLQNEQEAAQIWQTVESLENRLDSYGVTVEYDFPAPGVCSKDALTKTQLRDVVMRCRKYRLETQN